jgi:hypothetical protein
MKHALLLATLLVVTGCGLFMRPDPISFRSYELKGLSYEEGVSLVYDVTRRFLLERFGGIGLTWDPVTRNISVDDVHDGRRRLRLRIHIEPDGSDLNVEMLALVEHLSSGGSEGVGWTAPMQDVPLEEALYAAFVAELLARGDGSS